MMRNSLYILLSLFLITACVKRTDEPKHLISKSKMEDILMDISLSKAIPMEAIDSTLRMVPDKNNTILNSIMVKHHVTLKDFKESHAYYTVYPEEYNSILDNVSQKIDNQLKAFKKQDSLAELRKPKIDTVKPKPIKKTDKQKEDSIMKRLEQEGTINSVQRKKLKNVP